MPYDTPSEIVQKFVALGAVRCSVSQYRRRHPYTGAEILEVYPYLVYFWDARGNELGYWNQPLDNCQVFAPRYREWSPENLGRQVYAPLVRAETPP